MATSHLRPVELKTLCASVLIASGLLSGCGDLQSFSDSKKMREAPVQDLPLVPRQRVAPAAAQGNAAPAAVPDAQGPLYAVHLSAGVALPQTLPNGTAVGFSVDYQFKKGGSETQDKYVWIIQRRKGEPDIAPVNLAAKGTLQKFLPWRPEQGPFESYVAEIVEGGSHKAISKRVPMR